MSLKLIIHSDRQVTLSPAPIDPSWVLDGTPSARNSILSRSEDRTAFTMMWDCTAGKFDWHYSFDETLYILEGSVIIATADSPARRLDVGDLVFFPAGTTARWHVESYVRKVAFCRRVLPKPVSLAIRALQLSLSFVRRRVAKGQPTTAAVHKALTGI